MGSKKENLEELLQEYWRDIVAVYEGLQNGIFSNCQNLLYLPNCAAVLRKDFNQLDGKVI